jgi:glyoxalase family protein
MDVRQTNINTKSKALDAYRTLVRAAQIATSTIDRHLREWRLTVSQWGILDALHHLGPLTQKDLAIQHLMSNANITMIVDNLEKRGLVQRRRQSSDRRYIKVHLTEEGTRMFEEISPRHVMNIVGEMSALKPSEQEALARLCRKFGVKSERHEARITSELLTRFVQRQEAVMNGEILGLHHVTAIAGDPDRNLDFYTGVMGMRLVKKTVNFDDPGAYHFYYGDETGRPGTILTFFVWPSAPRGRRGPGQVTDLTFSVPDGSMPFWIDRLNRRGISFEGPTRRFEEEVLSFSDPEGLRLELVSPVGLRPANGWRNGPVPPEHGIVGFHSVTLSESQMKETNSLFLKTLDFHVIAEEGDRTRYLAGSPGKGTFLDVVGSPEGEVGRITVGTVHHVAWRVATDEIQLAWRNKLLASGRYVTPVKDRRYFNSIYFHEPGGVFFEIATDTPGFAVDERPDRLGSELMLPTWLETVRGQIEEALPRLRMTKLGRAA